MRQPSCEAVLNQEAAFPLHTVSWAQGKQVTESPHRDVEDRLGERCISNEAQAPIKQLVTDELAMLVEGSLDDIPCTSYCNAQSGIRSVVYRVLEQVMLDLLRKDVIEETMDAHIAKVLNTYAAADEISEKLLTSSSFIAPITTFVPYKTNLFIVDQNTVFAKASQRKPWAALEVDRQVKRYSQSSKSSKRKYDSQEE